MKIFFRLLGGFVLGGLLLVFLPLAMLCGLLMRFPFKKFVRAALAVGGAAFAIHEIAKLLDTDKISLRKRLYEALAPKSAKALPAPERMPYSTTPAVETQLIAALRSLGYTAEQAKETAWTTVTRLPEQTDLATLVKEALRVRA